MKKFYQTARAKQSATQEFYVQTRQEGAERAKEWDYSLIAVQHDDRLKSLFAK